MISGRVVGFDGTPVAGDAGARVAIVAVDGDDLLRVTDGRTLPRRRFDELVEGGYITAVTGEVLASCLDGRAVYRSIGERRAGVAEELDHVRWTRQHDIEVTYLRQQEVRAVLDAHADSKRLEALAAHADGRSTDAVRLAREGLMAVPGLRESPLAAELYAVLVAVSFVDADANRQVRREIGLMLDPGLRDVALLRGYSVFAGHSARRASPELRDVDLARATSRPPRTFAAAYRELEA